MSDHLHDALRGVIEQTPEGIALSFLNNLARADGLLREWAAYEIADADHHAQWFREMDEEDERR